jgi:hypothetical protein
MKKIIAAVLLLVATLNVNAQRKLEKIWETDTIIKTPESVLFDANRNVLYVSLIDGQPWEADGKGGIAKISVDGTEINQEWITGLHCPKGMAISGGSLYVADLDEVVVINIKKGAIEKRIKPEGAAQLNDVTVASKGVLYVSDSKFGKVFKIENDKASLYLENLPGVNGLRFVGKDLYIAAGKEFVKADAKKQITKVATLPQGGDGVEPVGPYGDFLVTAWMGYIYYVHVNGNVDVLVDTHDMKRNAADIGLDPTKYIVYVPTFFGKTVAAYQLK